MATKYIKHEDAEWRIVWMGGNTIVEAEKGKEAMYVPRIGVFIKAPDDHHTRVFIPVRSIVELRSVWRGGGNKTKDGLGIWIEEQFMTPSELARARRPEPVVPN